MCYNYLCTCVHLLHALMCLQTEEVHTLYDLQLTYAYTRTHARLKDVHTQTNKQTNKQLNKRPKGSRSHAGGEWGLLKVYDAVLHFAHHLRFLTHTHANTRRTCVHTTLALRTRLAKTTHSSSLVSFSSFN